jgi:hypothetical protein
MMQEKAAETITKRKQEKMKNVSPRNRKACHNINTALMQSVAEI